MFDVCSLSPDPAALLAEARAQGVYVFGAGSFARAARAALTHQGVSVHAYVVTNPTAPTLDGLPVLALDTLASEARRLPLWVGVYNREAASDLADIAAACRARGIERVLLPQDYYEALAERLGWRFWLTDRRDYARVGAQLGAVHAGLADQQSRDFFDATLRFRAGGDIGTGPCPTDTPQYFPPEVLSALANRGERCVFIDGGAYDGDTIAQAAAALPLGHACAFEPDLANFTRLAANLAGLGVPVTAFACGLSAVSEWLAFAAYHRWDDLWRIPAFISELSAGYQLLYRTHEHNTFESVFYAVPGRV